MGRNNLAQNTFNDATNQSIVFIYSQLCEVFMVNFVIHNEHLLKIQHDL